jgi:predicted transglutaminase-like protease
MTNCWPFSFLIFFFKNELPLQLSSGMLIELHSLLCYSYKIFTFNGNRYGSAGCSIVFQLVIFIYGISFPL